MSQTNKQEYDETSCASDECGKEILDPIVCESNYCSMKCAIEENSEVCAFCENVAISSVNIHAGVVTISFGKMYRCIHCTHIACSECMRSVDICIHCNIY